MNIPLTGHLDSVIGRHELVATPDSATIYPPDTPTSIRRWSESCRIIGVRFERDYLHREMTNILAGHNVPVPDHLDLSTPAGAGWLRWSGHCRTHRQVSSIPLSHNNFPGH